MDSSFWHLNRGPTIGLCLHPRQEVPTCSSGEESVEAGIEGDLSLDFASASESDDEVLPLFADTFLLALELLDLDLEEEVLRFFADPFGFPSALDLLLGALCFRQGDGLLSLFLLPDVLLDFLATFKFEGDLSIFLLCGDFVFFEGGDFEADLLVFLAGDDFAFFAGSDFEGDLFPFLLCGVFAFLGDGDFEGEPFAFLPRGFFTVGELAWL